MQRTGSLLTQTTYRRSKIRIRRFITIWRINICRSRTTSLSSYHRRRRRSFSISKHQTSSNWLYLANYRFSKSTKSLRQLNVKSRHSTSLQSFTQSRSWLSHCLSWPNHLKLRLSQSSSVY